MMMRDTGRVATWTELDRTTTTKISLAVADAPLYDDLPSIRVQPEKVTFWIIDSTLTALGFQGRIVSGPGSRGESTMATTFRVEQAPTWLLDLAQQVI